MPITGSVELEVRPRVWDSCASVRPLAMQTRRVDAIDRIGPNVDVAVCLLQVHDLIDGILLGPTSSLGIVITGAQVREAARGSHAAGVSKDRVSGVEVAAVRVVLVGGGERPGRAGGAGHRAAFIVEQVAAGASGLLSDDGAVSVAGVVGGG